MSRVLEVRIHCQVARKTSPGVKGWILDEVADVQISGAISDYPGLC
ncbi:hypothetical protein ACFLIN_09690 [Corynebacterium kutscheri]|nr:hypothetical protein [Corynebacterium kutscheri]